MNCEVILGSCDAVLGRQRLSPRKTRNVRNWIKLRPNCLFLTLIKLVFPFPSQSICLNFNLTDSPSDPKIWPWCSNKDHATEVSHLGREKQQMQVFIWLVCNPQPLDGKHSLQQLLQKRLLQPNVSLSRWLLMLLGRPEPELSGQFFIYHQRKKNLGRELHVTQCAFLSQAQNQAVPTGHTDRTLALAGLLNSCSHSRDRVENRPVADRIPPNVSWD